MRRCKHLHSCSLDSLHPWIWCLCWCAVACIVEDLHVIMKKHIGAFLMNCCWPGMQGDGLGAVHILFFSRRASLEVELHMDMCVAARWATHCMAVQAYSCAKRWQLMQYAIVSLAWQCRSVATTFESRLS